MKRRNSIKEMPVMIPLVFLLMGTIALPPLLYEFINPKSDGLGIFSSVFMITFFGGTTVGAITILYKKTLYYRQEIRKNSQSIFMFFYKKYWYPEAYLERRKNKSRTNKIRHYIGIFIICIFSVNIIKMVLFDQSETSLIIYVGAIFAILYIIAYCHKNLL